MRRRGSGQVVQIASGLSYFGRADWSQYLQILYLPGSGELTVYCLALMGAALGFLWFNAHPAQVFMGDTGSLALGGALAGLAITSRTELLLVLVGGLFVLISLSVIVQVGFFKATGRRVFRMAPLQHHFELVGWGEVTIVIRFWIIAGLLVGGFENVFQLYRGVTERDLYVMLLLFAFLVFRPGGLFAPGGRT